MVASKSSKTSEPQEPFAPGTLVHRLLQAIAHAISERLGQAHDLRDLNKLRRPPRNKAR